MIFAPTANTSFTGIARPAFGKHAQHVPGTPAPLKGKALARYQRAARTAAELLPEIPRPGESIRVMMVGSFDLMQVITATMRLVPHCRHVRIATLCLSKRNAADLLSLLDVHRGLSVTLLASSFFKANNKELWEWFRDELQEFPTARLAAARSHCKVVAFDLDDGDGLVFEGSANLRTNKNLELLVATRDRALHDWHATWIDELMSRDDGEEN